MERRNRSLEVLKRLVYIDSLEDPEMKAELLSRWVEENLSSNKIGDLELNTDELKTLSENLYKNMNFLKVHKDSIKNQLDSHHKIKKFLK